MNLEKIIKSKEVENQQVSTEEIRAILSALDIVDFADYQKEILPELKAFKSILFNYSLECVKNELEATVPSKELTIIDDIRVYNLIRAIYTKIGKELEKFEEC